MGGMFYYASAFNQKINSWQTDAVTDTMSAFTGANAFNQPLNSW